MSKRILPNNFRENLVKKYMVGPIEDRLFLWATKKISGEITWSWCTW